MFDPIPQLQDFLHASARRLPDKIALVCEEKRLTYRELDVQSNAMAHMLANGGVVRGDRVLIFFDNSVETVLHFWAALKANAVATIINPLTKRDKLAYLLGDCRPKAFVSSAHLESTWGEPVRNCSHVATAIIHGAAADAMFGLAKDVIQFNQTVADGQASPPLRRNIDIDLAAIVYTSGSTGEPKGVMLTHRNMLTAANSISAYLNIQEDDVILNALPMAFDYGLYQMIMAFRTGARLVLAKSFAFIPEVLKLAVDEGVTGFPGIPTAFSMLAELKDLSDYDFSKIRFVTNTAAALPVKHIHMLKELFPKARIYSMYGLTECKRCTYLPPEDIDRKPTSVGIAIPNTEMWIVDEHGQKVSPNTVGQLVIRGATVMKGYWEKPEATARKLKHGPLPGEQVLYTGDYCRMDEDGYLYFVGRMDEVIKSRGEKVAPKEVEAVLYGIQGVKDAAVKGVPDEILGQAIKAFVVLERGVSLSELQIQTACRQSLESFMVPKYVQFMPDLPKTDTGKIKKSELD